MLYSPALQLRKWYGVEGQVLPRDGGQQGEAEPQPEEEEPAEREYIAVLDADSSPMAEQARAMKVKPNLRLLAIAARAAVVRSLLSLHMCGVGPVCRRRRAVRPSGPTCLPSLARGPPLHLMQVVLQLILKRSKIRALVRDVGAAKSGFGPYIEAVQGDSSDAAAVRRLLRGAKAAVCCSKLGALLPAAAAARVPHVVLLTASPAGGGLGSLFAGAEQQALGDASREAALRASGLPHTIVQVSAAVVVVAAVVAVAAFAVAIASRDL